MGEKETNDRTIGRYRILEEIGRGGMATVYRAKDTSLGREVALKLLHPHLASHGESKARFQREAQAVARLKHDALLEIYDYSGEEGDDVFIVMELIKGTTLRRLLEQQKEAPMPAEAAALILREVARALAHAHAHGIVHRDVKPENILIDPCGAIKLSDFGIAHLTDMSQMTVTGQILGSPAYMSPEHVELAELDARADAFSLGIVLYEAAVGRQPFTGKNPHAVLKCIVEGIFDDPLAVNPGVGHPVAEIIRKCLRTDLDERYQTVEEIQRDLETALEAVGITAPEEALCDYLADTEAWSEAVRPIIIEQTLKLGQRAKRARRHREAMDHFNRVLSLQPGHERALQAVAGMNRSQQIRYVLEKAAAAVTFLLIISAVIWVAARPEPAPRATPPAVGAVRAEAPPPPTPEPLVQAVEPGDTGDPLTSVILPDTPAPPAAKSEAGDDRPKTPPAAAARRAQRPRTAKADPKALREVVFTPHPLAVTVVIDGKDRFPFGPAHRSKKLPVGRHTITFVPNDAKRFREQSWEVDIPDGEGPYPFRGRLLWQPARLLVESNVSAEVTVPGRVTDKTGRPFGVEVKKGPSEKLSILVSREGYVPQTKQVTITAGEISTLRVELRPATESP